MGAVRSLFLYHCIRNRNGMKTTGRIRTLDMVFAFLGGCVLLFIIAPLAGMFLKTSFMEIGEVASDTQVSNSIWITLAISISATFLFAFLSVPFAWMLARKKFRGRKLVNGIIDLPIVIPHTAAGIAILGIVSRGTFLGEAADRAGFSFVGHPLGIGLAMAFVSLPFLINAARDGFEAVPERLEKAALNLGATPLKVFLTISLPLAWRNILSGGIMMFARGMSEFGAVIIIAYHPMTTPVLIYDRFGAFGLSYARPVAVLFILVSLAFFIALRFISKRNQKDA